MQTYNTMRKRSNDKSKDACNTAGGCKEMMNGGVFCASWKQIEESPPKLGSLIRKSEMPVSPCGGLGSDRRRFQGVRRSDRRGTVVDRLGSEIGAGHGILVDLPSQLCIV